MEAVERVSVSVVSLPLRASVSSATHTISELSNVVVEVEAGGHIGLGYAVALSQHHAKAIEVLAGRYASLLVGTGVPGMRRFWRTSWKAANFHGQAGPGISALAAVDTALWDLHGRSLGLPLFRLLGGEPAELNVYATGGWLSLDLKSLLDEAAQIQDSGFGWYKMKVGKPDPADDVRRVSSVSRHFPALGLMLDANQAWTAKEAIRIGRQLEEFNIAWLEEPVEARDYVGAARVVNELNIPICSGETLWGANELRQLAAAGAADIFNPDLMRCGGVSGLLEVCSWAAANEVPVTPHTFIESSSHVLAALGVSGFLEYVPGWWNRLFEEDLVVNGSLSFLDNPGLGVTLSQKAREAHTKTVNDYR